jgi:predicted PurR-regulated permease PerM
VGEENADGRGESAAPGATGTGLALAPAPAPAHEAVPGHETPPGAPPSDPTPIAVSPRTRAILGGLAVAAVVWLFWVAPVVPRLLLTGAVLALVLSFPVRLLGRVMPRALAILLVVVGLVLLVLLVLVVLIPTVIVQLTELVAALPGYATEAEAALRDGIARLQERGLLSREQQPDQVVEQVRDEIFARGQDALEEVVAGVLNALTGAIGVLIQLFGVLFVAIYLLADVGRFKTGMLAAVPPRYQDDLETLWGMLSQSLSRYLGGLLVSIVIQSTAVTLALWALGVEFALLLGLWMAATAVLPYVGAFLGAIPAVIVALFESPLTAVAVAVVYLLVNQLEGNVLTPRIQGEAVRVHPLLIFLGVLAGSEVAGLLGAALAVPAMAVIRVLFDFFGERLYVRQPTAGPVEAKTLGIGAGAAANGGPARPPRPEGARPRLGRLVRNATTRVERPKPPRRN